MRALLLCCVFSFSAWAQVIERAAEVPAMKRFEIALNPLTVQLNGRDTSHVGFNGSFQVQLAERFGLVVGGGYNWLSQTSAFATQMIELARVDPGVPAPSLTTWTANAGVEFRPFSGDLTFLNAGGVKFSVVLRGLAGVVGRRHELIPLRTSFDGSSTAPTYGEVEPRFAATVAAGLRVQFGETVAVRVDVSDTLNSSRVDRVNGCSIDDLRALDGRLRLGLDVGGSEVSSACSVSKFSDVRGGDVAQALNVVRLPSPALAQFVQLSAGMSFSF